jgi:hypothetical protein
LQDEVKWPNYGRLARLHHLRRPPARPNRYPEPTGAMAWRTLAYDDREWTVSVAVERRPGSDDWILVAAFRCPAPDSRRFWVPLQISSPSKAALFARADALSQDDLASALRDRLIA